MINGKRQVTSLFHCMAATSLTRRFYLKRQQFANDRRGEKSGARTAIYPEVRSCGKKLGNRCCSFAISLTLPFGSFWNIPPSMICFCQEGRQFDGHARLPSFNNGVIRIRPTPPPPAAIVKVKGSRRIKGESTPWAWISIKSSIKRSFFCICWRHA